MNGQYCRHSGACRNPVFYRVSGWPHSQAWQREGASSNFEIGSTTGTTDWRVVAIAAWAHPAACVEVVLSTPLLASRQDYKPIENVYLPRAWVNIKTIRSLTRRVRMIIDNIFGCYGGQGSCWYLLPGLHQPLTQPSRSQNALHCK